MPYKFHNKCLIRVPLLSCNELVNMDNIDFILSLDAFKEAIFIASPSLYEEVYIKGDKSERTCMSIVKYFTRACTRCTPYGLFAGCSLVEFGELSTITLSSIDKVKTYSRIDMEYLCEFIRLLEMTQNYRESLVYHINTSLYYIGNNIRYIEYQMFKKKRKYTFSEVQNSEYIVAVLQKLSGKDLTFQELVNTIVSDEISVSEAQKFINTLIAEQIIVSNLEPAVSGDDIIYQIRKGLDWIGQHNNFIDEIITSLRLCDERPIGHRILQYKEIKDKLTSVIPQYKSDNLLHVDSYNTIAQGSIGPSITSAILKGIEVLAKITPYSENNLLSAFKNKFHSRFEEQEVLLTTVLDPQTGVGFGQWNEMRGDINPLIDDLPIPIERVSPSAISINALTKMMIPKYDNAIKNSDYVINITPSDINQFNYNSNLLPDQLYSIISVISVDDKKSNATIVMDRVGAGSSAKLISRFGYLDETIQNFVDEITTYETNLHAFKIVAEVLHLPEDRLGNIQMHPDSRKYGISYMSNPIKKDSCVEMIPIDDIYVSVPNGRKIILKSRKYQKEILPILTTAHNFSKGLPIYSFLSYLEAQNNQGLYFDWGGYFESKHFLPRVMYENIILSPAQWRVSITDIPLSNDHAKIDSADIDKWRTVNKIPDSVLIIEGDNKLYINFTKTLHIKIFLKELNKKKTIVIEEFLFSETANNLITRDNEFFANELIVCLHKN